MGGIVAILERQVSQLRPGKAKEVIEISKRFDLIEKRMGFPLKRFYSSIAGEPTNTMVMEREWESLAAMESVWALARADAEWQGLRAQRSDLSIGHRTEFYTVVDQA
jgi:hypothetical protein